MPGAQNGELVRGLNAFDTTMLVIGGVIGSGIFLTTGVIARDLPQPWLILAVWVLGGAFALAGALTFAELGAAWPESGGPYVYLREAYGSWAGFLFGWLTLVAYQTGGIATVAVGFAEFLGYFVPALGTDQVLRSWTLGSFTQSLSVGQLIACIVILAMTWTNVAGLRLGALVQNGLTLSKLAAIGAFALLGIWLGGAGAFSGESATALPQLGSSSVFAAMGVALVAVLWTYDGWTSVTFTAGEVRNPARNLPRALIVGVLAVTVVYVLTNVAYLRALSLPELSGELRVAEKAATALFGTTGTGFIAAAVLVSTLGAVNATVLTGGRVYYAMARDGVFFRAVGRVHARFRTPHVALWVQGAWACVLALSGGYEALFIYTTFASLLIYLGTGAAIFRLRQTQNDVPRPYRVPGYPWIPGLFVMAVLLLLYNTVRERPIESIAGLGLLAIGLPAFAYWTRSRRKGTDSA